MNERIKELAKQAGFDVEETTGGGDVWFDEGWNTELVERFAELVRQDLYQVIGKSVIEQINSAVQMEREACVKLCVGIGSTKNGYGCAAAIRARSKHD